VPMTLSRNHGNSLGPQRGMTTERFEDARVGIYLVAILGGIVAMQAYGICPFPLLRSEIAMADARVKASRCG